MTAASRGRNNRSRGHARERQVADIYGGYRTGSDQGGQHGDVQTRELVIEVKSRQQATPKLISGAWAQAQAAADATGKDPLVVLAYTPGSGKPIEYWEVRKIG